ncbi:PREDICTED: transmembrane protein 14C-like [Priapulus caudatus]|uniref:Transmembrane protein 14C-like n=1 Tax=Priapulus caudatus TaxID=37621 RepID=A0ABM1E3M1_PRICU|nr:PREDICTED: transmembrane protein 14C-like [Priapulus caudatus]
MADVLGYVYAATVMVGGIIGYVKAGSAISLGMGLLFGTVLLFGAYQTSQNAGNVLVALVCSGILAGVMGPRFVRSWKFMPAGLMTILSVLNAVRLAYVLISANRQ